MNEARLVDGISPSRSNEQRTGSFAHGLPIVRTPAPHFHVSYPMFKIGSLSKYLLARVLLYSLLLSVLTSVVNGWLAYQSGLERQQMQVQSVLAAYRTTLIKSVWELDYESAQAQMQGLARFPAVLSAKLVSAAPLISYQKAGANLEQNSTQIKVPLLMPNGKHELGMLELRLDREALQQEVWNEACRFTLIVSSELLLLALLLFFLLRRHISTPIQALSAHVQQMNEARLTIAAPLPTEQKRHEIHDLADGITRLQYDLLGQFSLRDTVAKELAEHRDQLNQVLVQQEHQLDIVLHTMADGGAVLNGQGRILFVNPAWCRLMSDIAADLLVGSWPLQWLHSPTWQTLAEQLQINDSLLGESLLLNRIDAQTLPVEASFSVLERDEHGVPSRIQIMVRDLTARLETERVLIAAKESALEASQTKSAFLANMSHEIRTPLNAVLGFSSLLADTELDAHQQQFIHNIRESGTALLTLLNDILDFSKIEAGQLRLEKIAFDLRSLLEDTQDIVAVPAQHKGLELVCLVDANVPLNVIGDPGRLRQILLNLLNNAVKFTPRGEILTQARLVHREDQVVRVRIEVQDNGIGIAEDVQAQLFQPFQQADVSTTRRFGGTGLGLSICRRLASAMNGQIGVHSQVGAGALFWFEIELGLGRVEANKARNVNLLAEKVVAVLSPSLGNRQKLNADLKLMNCTVTLVDSEVALMALLQKTTPALDLILVDLPLAAEMAVELPNKIHALADYANTPVLLSVTQGAMGQAGLADRAGYAAYLSKPIHFDALQHCLVEALHQVGQAEGPLLTLHRLAEFEARTRNRVLLVEDNPMNQKIGVLLLEKLGCRVDVSNNGIEALSAVQSHSYDLILMDCQMPEMDGFDATRLIRQLPAGMNKVPIVALTANAFAEDRSRCLEAGMDDFMTKPVQLDALALMLKKWLQAGDAS